MKKLIVVLLTVMILINGFVVLDYFNFSFINISLDNVDKSVTFGLLIANLAVAVFIFYQIRQTSNHFLALNRPWISLHINKESSMNTIASLTNFSMYLENSGKLSAKNLMITYEKIGIIKSNENLTFDKIELLEVYPNYSEKLSDNVYSGNVNMGYKFTIKYEYDKEKVSNVVYLYHPHRYTVRISDIKPEIPRSASV